MKRPKKIPALPGVYVFRHGKTPLYIGKAANLKQRLASYFQKSADTSPRIRLMLGEATRLEIIKLPSEIEALLKETELIKKYRPKYNILMRDDKNYSYVALTRDPFPRIFITHQPYRDRKLRSSQRGASYLGPFTGGFALQAALKALRRIFSYCTCKQPHKRPCLNSEIGRCPGYCCLFPRMPVAERFARRQRRVYRENIRNIVAVLSGGRRRLVGRLKRELKTAVKTERYEEAARLRDAVFGLEDVFSHRGLVHTTGSAGPTTSGARHPWPLVAAKLRSLLKTERAVHRIEGYDIANIGAEAATGSMVVFTSGQPEKNQYRKFRIRSVPGANDVAMLKEMLYRRFNHPEWHAPDMIVIDGGKPQLGAALSALRGLTSKRPLITALAKREEILFTENGRVIPLRRQDQALLHLFQRIRDESHRFARVYHHTLRARAYAQAR